MASLDTRRPAAMEQLAVLGQQVDVRHAADRRRARRRVQIARRAIEAGRLGGYDVVLLDTAGRITLDEEMMSGGRRGQARRQSARGAAGRRRADRPGRRQSRALVRRARRPHRHRADPRRRRRPRRRGAVDARGHRQADQADRHRREAWTRWRTSIPRASPAASSAWATSSRWSRRPRPRSTPRRRCAPPSRCARAQFDLADLREQLAQMQKMGGMGGLMGMMPGVAKMKNQIAERNLDDSVLKRQMAIIDSMTPQRARATPTSSRRAARSASPPAPAPRPRRSTSS